MTTRLLLMVTVLLTAILLETVLFAGAAVAGQVPAVVALTVIAFGLTDGAETGVRYGFFAGLTVDLLSGGLVGLSALILLFLGYGAGVVRPYLTGSPFVAHLALGGMGAALATLAYGLLGALLDPVAVGAGGLVQATVVTALYSTLVAPAIIRPVAALARRVEVTVQP